MIRFLLILSSILLSLVFNLSAQIVKGLVSDSKGQPIPFVNVVSKGSGSGTQTDLNGLFQLSVSDSSAAVLEFSAIGFKRQSMPVGGAEFVKVTLLEDVQRLSEYQMVGYGTSSRKEMTAASSQVEGEDLTKLNVARMDQALQGQMAGVSVTTNSGSPGGSSSIRIRGLSTFGDNDPLILVDGVVYDSEGLNALNPSDIESVQVLKDASAGIYGVRAANGVILVTTKQGKKGAPMRITYDGYAGIQQTARQLNLLNAQEYAVIKNEMFAMGGQPLPFNNTNVGVGTPWQDSVFSSAPIQSHQLGIQGGSEKSTYSMGLGYFSQDGIVGGNKSHFSRYNGRLNFTHVLSKRVRFNSVLLFSSEFRRTLPENGIGSVLYNTINAFPTAPVRQPDGRFSYLEEVNDIINPIAQIQNQYNGVQTMKWVGKEEVEIDIFKGLTFTNRFNFNYATLHNKVFSPLVWYGPGKFANTAINEQLESPMVAIADSFMVERGAAVYEENTSFLDLSYEGFLNYETTVAEHHKLKGLIGFSLFERKGESLSGIGYGIPNNSLEFADISANTAAGGFLNNTFSWEFTERLLSYFGRIEYAYKEKYMISALLRRDGSSKFGSNNRYGWFPTIAGAWVISDEGFYSSSFIDYLKLRSSIGLSGNDQIPNFAYRALLNGEGVYVFDDVITSGVAIGTAANPDLKWESTLQMNVGIDFSLFNSIQLSLDVYEKRTSNLLFQPDVSALIGSYGPGGFPPVINAGDVLNRGFELELAYQTPVRSPFQFSGKYTFGMVHNEVLSVPVGIDYLPGAAFGVGGDVATRFQVGQPIGYFFGFETNGVFQSQEQIDNAPQQDGAQPGDLIFVDQNGDGVINFNDDSDKAFLGSPIPDFTMGLMLNAGFKGFDLSVNLYAAVGQEAIRNYERQQPFANQLDYVIDRWVGPGSTNEHPRLTTEPTRNAIFSSYFVEDASFLRIRNIQLGYSLPTKWLSKLKIQGIRIYGSVNNAFTFTAYKGFDPEFSSASILSAGVDNGFYPQARSFMGGVQIKF
jgi:TonB-linked SusC/RagA family outer membrane protein